MKQCVWQNRRWKRFASRSPCSAAEGVADRKNPLLIRKPMSQPIASLSLDLDNKWSYLKTHGDRGWETHPSYLDVVVPRILEVLSELKLKITVFVVGQDAALPSNDAALAAIGQAGHGIGNHSLRHEPWLHRY